MGFAATINGVSGFITNSHCTSDGITGGGLGQTTYRQGAADGVDIAIESLDIVGFSFRGSTGHNRKMPHQRSV